MVLGDINDQIVALLIHHLNTALLFGYYARNMSIAQARVQSKPTVLDEHAKM